jgi:hypothetical protein
LHIARPEILVITFLFLTFGVEESRELPAEGSIDSILFILYILKSELGTVSAPVAKGRIKLQQT